MTLPTLLSIQVGKPAEHGADDISDKTWESGIFKYPVAGRVWLDELNLAGDGQADLKNHGGAYRAVLTYAADHYPIWESELDHKLPYGAFGENFTITQVDEATVCLGDVYQLGETRLQVAQPRFPCWKLARRNNRRELTALVEEKGWGGWYQRVLQTGYVQAGDTYELIERPYPQFNIAFLNDLISERDFDEAACAAIAGVEALTREWQAMFMKMSRR